MTDNQYKNEIASGHAGKVTDGVKALQGDPKKAIVKLAIPMIVAMFVQTVYSLVDTYWVSGLGADALAAMGFVFPFFFISMALSNGVGIGGGSAISRRIGAKDKVGADNVAIHTIVMIFLLSLAFTLPFYMFAPQLFTLAGAGKTTELAVSYARVVFLGSLIVFFSNAANSILRSEGDSKRAMRAMILGAILNIVLDPIFIYTLKMGIAGAAWATVISIAVSSLMMANWLFFRKDTYVKFNFKDFSFNREIIRDILNVSVPASVQQLSMSLHYCFSQRYGRRRSLCHRLENSNNCNLSPYGNRYSRNFSIRSRHWVQGLYKSRNSPFLFNKTGFPYGMWGWNPYFYLRHTDSFDLYSG
jgi:Na+-driven multidrug efflux pump